MKKIADIKQDKNLAVKNPATVKGGTCSCGDKRPKGYDSTYSTSSWGGFWGGSW
jgi:hypothetical protein